MSPSTKASVAAALAALPFVLLAACSSAPGGEATGSSAAAISGPDVVSRGMEWVNADLHYCMSHYGAYDPDQSCWPDEPSSHVCDRESNAAWNPYRSDCSGFVTWAWGLPPVGDGGYVTGEFAPYDDAFSFEVSAGDLEPGDAANLNQEGIDLDGVGHIILFKEWANGAHSAATFMEEPGCSANPPHAHEWTSPVSISGHTITLLDRDRTFYTIRFNGNGGAGSTSGGSGGAKCELAGKKYATNTCTETKQCDNGSWVARSNDPAGCNPGVLPDGACLNDSGGTDSMNTCTSTLQCDDGIWVTRSDDPSACHGSSSAGGGSSGGGSSSGGSGSCSLAGHSYKTNTCTETKQCDDGHWVARTGDRAECDSGVLANGACLTDSGQVDAKNTCTSSQQCDNGVWVDRFDDPTSCR